MAVDSNKIHAFATTYLAVFENPDATEHEVKYGFSDACFDIGFEMDCGKSFVQAYSERAFNNADALTEIIHSVDNIELLGSAIFSQYRYLTHWSEGESFLDSNYRPWFIAAFKRLAELSKP